MLEYVKICPKCGRENPETSDICSNEGEFLGMVEPIPKQTEHSAPSTLQTDAENQMRNHDTAPKKCEHQEKRATNRYENPPLFYLEIPGIEKIYTIRHGNVLGQAHSTSDADVQLSGISGVNFVHRRQCRFDYLDGKWNVTAIKQDEFTNPTFVNHNRLEPGQKRTLANGDRLILCNITFTVRIMES